MDGIKVKGLLEKLQNVNPEYDVDLFSLGGIFTIKRVEVITTPGTYEGVTLWID